MENNYFENARFNDGWELPLQITLFGVDFSVVALADAYYETDKVTEEQNGSYEIFIKHKNNIIGKVEEILKKEAGTEEKARLRFEPSFLKIKRDGSYGLVFDDENDLENGIVISISPDYSVVCTDEYF